MPLVCLCGESHPGFVAFLVCVLYERLDPWCSGPSLQDVGNVSETSHRRRSLMERDDLGELKGEYQCAGHAPGIFF